MVSSSVKTMSFLSNQAVSTRSEISTDNKTADFAKMMDESINKVKDTDVKDEVKQESKIEDSSTVKENEFDKKFEESKNVSETEEQAQTEEVSKEVSQEITEDIPEEMSQEVSEEILNVIAVILNVPVSELKNSLEQLDISSEDLLNVNDVTDLVMDMKNIDTKLELIINEDASNAIKDIQQAVEMVMQNAKQNENTSDISLVTDTQVQVMDETVQENPKETVEDTVENDSKEMPETAANVTSVEADSKTEGQEFNSNSQKDESDKHDVQMKDVLENPLNDLKGNILNEIEVALDERVNENISARIINQITDNISVAIRESMTSLEMQLYPEHLGKVTVVLATEEGGITAKITAETEMAKNAIEQQLTILKDNFEKQGLKVTDVEVTIASHSFEQNLDKNDSNNENQQRRTGRIRKSLLDEVNGIAEEEEKENIVMQTLGNTVSYLA